MRTVLAGLASSLLLAAVVLVVLSPDDISSEGISSVPTSSLSTAGSWTIELIVSPPSFDEAAVSDFNIQLAHMLHLPEAHIDTSIIGGQVSRRLMGHKSEAQDGQPVRLVATVTGLNGAQITQAYRRYNAATDFLSSTTAASEALGVRVLELQDPVDQWPPNEKRTALYWDGKNPIDMPRSLVEKGNVAETVYSFSPEEMVSAGLTVNGTHAIFPLPKDHQKQLIRAGVTQKYNTPGMERTRSGIAVLQALQTPISMFPDTLGGFAEKISITSHTGAWGAKEAASWEAALTIPPTKQSDLDRSKALAGQPQGQQWLNRSKAVFKQMSSSRFGASLLESLADPLQLEVLRGMQDAKKAPSFVSDPPKEMSEEAVRWSNGASNTIVKGHQTNCIHFTNAEGVVPLAGAMAFPLNTPILTYKGQTEQPTHTISMMGGIGAFSYDTETGTLQIRIAFSMEGIVRDPDYTRPQDAMTQGVYAQSPPNGVDFTSFQKESDGSIKDDRDVSKSVPSEYAHNMYKEITTKTPIDFGMMYLDLSHWCRGKDVIATKVADFEAIFQYLHNESQNTIWNQPHTPIAQALFQQASRFSQLSSNTYVGTAITVTTPCGNIFERSTTGPKNFVGLLEMTTWAHFMLEQSAITPETIYYAASRQGWNDVQ